MGIGKRALQAGALAGVVVLAGCSVNVNKDRDGHDKDVSLHTPFGGLQVHNGDHGPINTGLPLYPGAVVEPSGNDNGKSVDLKMGFGPWQMQVQVGSYISSDPAAKVQAFYRKALGDYGEVLTCHGNIAVGAPTRTGSGLTCKDNEDNKTTRITHDDDLELKAGSQRKQHIVAFDSKKHPGTHFALISLSLPRSGETGKSDGDEE